MKSVREMDNNEFCESCGAPAERQFTPRVHIKGAKVEHPEYNPALGCVVKNSKHRAELAKRKGLVEVGNDFGSGEKLQESFDRARKAKLAKDYLDE
jgi:hypothetical protein